MCALFLSSPSAFRRTGKHEELAGDVAVDHVWTRFHKLRHQFHVLVVLVNVYVQCMLIWKYIKCMRILSRILFARYYVISTIFGIKLSAC